MSEMIFSCEYLDWNTDSECLQFLPDPELVERFVQPQLDNVAVDRLHTLLRQHKYLEDPDELPMFPC